MATWSIPLSKTDAQLNNNYPSTINIYGHVFMEQIKNFANIIIHTYKNKEFSFIDGCIKILTDYSLSIVLFTHKDVLFQ